jgi:hypothetical protein
LHDSKESESREWNGHEAVKAHNLLFGLHLDLGELLAAELDLDDNHPAD